VHVSSLYDNADLYDLIAPRDAAMEAFYSDAARQNGPRVLELACGSGRFAVPLAEAGLTVTGLDLSESMLERAREVAAERRVAVVFVAGDIRNFDLGGRRFETVMIAANSIMHLLTADDFRAFFACVARHLAPGGKLLFDCFVPSARLLSRPGERQAMTTANHPELGEITIEETVDYDPVTQVADSTWFWSTAAERDFHVTPLQLRQIYPKELPLLLEANGFRLAERFGDFNRSPFGSTSWRQVCISERAS
jgi:SAM-dependent methyltransferase